MLLIKKSHLISLLLICLIALGTLAIIGSVSAIDMDNADIDGSNYVYNINNHDIASDDYDLSASASSDSLKSNDFNSLNSSDIGDSIKSDYEESSFSSDADKSKSNLKDSDINVYYVSNSGDDSNSGLTKEDAYLTINNALNNLDSNSNTIIYLSEGIYSEENNFTSIGNLTIIGQGIDKTYLDGENSHRIAKISDSSLRFINLSFINGYEHSGGAIYNEANLTLKNCSFLNNRASGGTFNNHSNWTNGGAIYNSGRLIVDDSSFNNSLAGSIYTEFAFGGAIYNIGELNVNNSKFSNNEIDTFMTWNRYGWEEFNVTQRGGAIYSLSDNIMISNSEFSNSALRCFELNTNPDKYFLHFSEGGAVYINGSDCKIFNSSFINNTADIGGAVFFIGDNNYFDRCIYKNNSAFLGGAIMTIDYNLNGHSFSTFRNLTNTIYSNFTLNNSVFEDNYIILLDDMEINFPTGYGAGAGFLKINNIYIYNSTFKSNGLNGESDYSIYLSNHLSYDNENYCHGGALFLYGQNSTVENSSFIDNMGDIGGAIQNYGFDTKILSSTFINNTAELWDGGAIFHSIGNLYVDDCTFDNNHAPNSGGTIYASYDYGNEHLFEQNSVYNNSAFYNSNASYGGAIFDTANSVTYENLRFENNSANYGGAIYSQGFSNSYIGSTFINNSAFGKDYSNGGAIYQYGSNCLIDSCIFINNSADLEGGAIFNFGESSIAINNEFENNSAYIGGSVYLSGNGGRFQNNTVSSSYAINGGGLYNANTNLICLNNTFNNCIANVSGGAIYNLVSTLELYSNSMKNCRANLTGNGAGNYIFTCGNISYLVISFANNAQFNIVDNKSVLLVANIIDNMGNPITGGIFSFILFNKSTNGTNGNGSNDSNGESGSGANGSGANGTNPGTSESTIIGACEVIEGIATLRYSLTMELGTSYLISGTYSYGAEPISTQMGSLNSVLSTRMYLSTNLFDNNIVFNDSLNYELILLDSENEYIPNAEILIYLDGVYSKSLFTNHVGYLNDSISNIATKGKHHYTFIYEGDIFHNRCTYDLDFEVFYNNTYYYDDMILRLVDLRYAIVQTSVNTTIPFEFLLSHYEGNALSQVSTPRYFLAYENNESFEIIDTVDYLGAVSGVDGLFYYVISQFAPPVKVRTTDLGGNFLIEANKTMPGLYEYNVCFIGGLVKQYNSSMHNYITEEDNYYNPCNVSFILIVDNPDANISTSLNFTSEDIVTEIDFPYYTLNLTDANNNSLVDKEIRIYDNGYYVGSAFTDCDGNADFRFPCMLDLGMHLIEFVYAGDEEYIGTYEILELDVLENPYKDDVAFFNMTPLNLTGPDNNLTVQLKDYYNNNLSNGTIKVELFFNPSDFETFTFGGFDKNTYSIGDNGYAYVKNFTLTTDEDGLFTVPLELGAGNYMVNCSYAGNKWYWGNSATFDINVNKVQSLLFGQSSINVLKNESYLNVILSTGDLKVLSNSKIRYLVLSENDSISFNQSIANASMAQLSAYIEGLPNYYGSFYAFTNESSISKLKISLPVGKYKLITVFEGDRWYNGSSLLTNLTIFGEKTKLETSQSTIIKKPGYYSVRLLDSKGNPLTGQTITITVDNETYTRYTDKNGEARLEIDLDYGNYTVLAQFNGNVNYSSSYVISNLFVVNEDYKYPSSMKVNSSSIYREKGQYAVALYGIDNERLSNRQIIINVNGTNYTSFTDNEGIASLNYNFTLGSYMIVSYFKGDNYYQNSNVSFILTVVAEDAANTVLNSSIYWVLKGKGNVYTVTLQDRIQNPIAGERIIFTVNDKEEYYSTTDSYGNANFVVNLDPGSYNINSYFRGSDVFYASSCYSKLVVLPVENATNGSNVINSSNSSAGVESSNSSSHSDDSGSGSQGTNSSSESSNSSSNNPDPDTGDSNSTGINNGSGSGGPNPGTGDSNSTGINNGSGSGGPNPGTGDSNSTGINNGSSSGSPDSGIGDSNSTGINNGSSSGTGSDVSNSSSSLDNSTSSNSSNINNNSTNVPINNSSSDVSGSSDINNTTSNSNNDTTNKTDLVNVPRTATRILYQNMTTTAVSKSDGRVGKYFEVILTDRKGLPLANKSISIGFNGRAYKRTTNATGGARLQINLGYGGKYTFAIAYLGDDDYKGSFEVALITVNKHKPKLNTSAKKSGKSISLMATLASANGNGISGKKISFTLNGKTYVSKTDSKGLAIVNVSLNKGNYTVTIKFAGDDCYRSTSKILTLRIVAPKK